MEERFRRYSSYLKNRYGKAVYRIGIDAGFGCPNRTGDSGACCYCDEEGSRAPYQKRECTCYFPLRDRKGPDPHDELWRSWIAHQIEGGRQFLEKRYGAEEFILYIQAFSGTWAPLNRLREIYDYALSFLDFREFTVGTRPDCVDQNVCDLLSSYRNSGRDVWLELGLQSFHDATLKRIGRGHGTAEFEAAYNCAGASGLKRSVHLIFGLPGEGEKEIMETVSRLASLRPEGVKIHNLHVAEGTSFARLWRKGELSVPDTETHLDWVATALELLPPETVIQRLTCDTPPSRLLAPAGFAPKGTFYQLLDAELDRRGVRQGGRFPSSGSH
jgi:uncharacterized protein